MTAVGFERSGNQRAPVVVLANSMFTTMAIWNDQLVPLGERLRVPDFQRSRRVTSLLPDHVADPSARGG